MMHLLKIEFLAPGRLWLLLVVPAIAIIFLLLANRKAVRGTTRSARLQRVLPKDGGWKRYVSVGLALASLASLIVAYAMPKDYTLQPRDRATVVVALDVSLSMRAEDVDPSRWAAAQEAATAFIESLPPRFNVAVVTFAATATVVVPPTVDRDAAIRGIEGLTLEPSTSIGEGIYGALRALELVPPDPEDPTAVPPAAIVLLSDGSTNIGRSSSSAAEAAAERGVPVYTIAYGTENGYVIDNGKRMQVPVNHAELAEVAKISGGKKFSAESASELSAVYEAIEQSVGYEKVYAEVTDRYAGYSLLFAVLAALGVISLGARWP